MDDVPISGLNAKPALPRRRDRVRAHLASAIVDHGIFRQIYQNLHEIAPGVYRSNQPTPRHLAHVQRLGVRTVINLRGPGGRLPQYLLERDACAALGLAMIDFPVYSRQLVPSEVVDAAIRLFKAIEYPVLFHCKSGADRAGFMSALYLLAHEGRPVEDAIGQLSLRYGHWRHSKTGVLDRFFEDFRDYQIRTGGDFATWLANEYDPERLQRDFHANRWANLLVDRVLRRE